MLTLSPDEPITNSAVPATSSRVGGGTVVANEALLGLLTATQTKLARLAKKKQVAESSEECKDIPSLLLRERARRRYIFLEHHNATQRTALKQYTRIEAASRRTVIEDEMNELVLLCVNHAETVSRLVVLTSESDHLSVLFSEGQRVRQHSAVRKQEEHHPTQRSPSNSNGAFDAMLSSVIDEEHDSRQELEADEVLERMGQKQLRCSEHEGLLTMSRRLSAATSTKAHRPSRDVSSVSQSIADDDDESGGVYRAPVLVPDSNKHPLGVPKDPEDQNTTLCALSNSVTQEISTEESSRRQRVEADQLGEMRKMSQEHTKRRFELRSSSRAPVARPFAHSTNTQDASSSNRSTAQNNWQEEQLAAARKEQDRHRRQAICLLNEEEDRERAAVSERYHRELMTLFHLRQKEKSQQETSASQQRYVRQVLVISDETQLREKIENDELASRRSIARLATQAAFQARRQPHQNAVVKASRPPSSLTDGGEKATPRSHQRDEGEGEGVATIAKQSFVTAADCERTSEVKTQLMTTECESRNEIATHEASDRRSALQHLDFRVGLQAICDAQLLERQSVETRELNAYHRSLTVFEESHQRSAIEAENRSRQEQLRSLSTTLVSEIVSGASRKSEAVTNQIKVVDSESLAAKELCDDEARDRHALQARFGLGLREVSERSFLVRHEKTSRSEVQQRWNVEVMQHSDALTLNAAHRDASLQAQRERFLSQRLGLTLQETDCRRHVEKLESEQAITLHSCGVQTAHQASTDCRSLSPETPAMVKCSPNQASLLSSTTDTMSDETAERFARFQQDRADSLVEKAVSHALTAVKSPTDASQCAPAPCAHDPHVAHQPLPQPQAPPGVVKAVPPPRRVLNTHPTSDGILCSDPSVQLEHVVSNEAKDREELTTCLYLNALTSLHCAYLIAGEACRRADIESQYRLQHMQLCHGIEERRETLYRGKHHGIEGIEAMEWSLLTESHTTYLKHSRESFETFALFHEHERCYRRIIVSAEQHSFDALKCIAQEEIDRRDVARAEAERAVWLVGEFKTSESTVMLRNRHELQCNALIASESKQRAAVDAQWISLAAMLEESEGLSRGILCELASDRDKEEGGRASLTEECETCWGILLKKEHTERCIALKAVHVLRQSTKESNQREQHLMEEKAKGDEAALIEAEMLQPVDGRLWPSSRASVAKVPFPPQSSPRRLGSGSSSSGHRRFQTSPFSEKTLRSIAEQRRPQSTGAQQRNKQLPPLAPNSDAPTTTPGHNEGNQNLKSSASSLARSSGDVVLVRHPNSAEGAKRVEEGDEEDGGDETWAVLDSEGDERAAIEDEEYFSFFHILLHRSIQVSTQMNHSRPGSSVSLVSRPVSAQVTSPACIDQHTVIVRCAQLGMSTLLKGGKSPSPGGIPLSATPLKRTPIKPPSSSPVSGTPRRPPGGPSSAASQRSASGNPKRLNGSFEFRSHRALNTPPIAFSPLPSLNTTQPSSPQPTSATPTALARSTVLEHQQMSWRQAKQLQQMLRSLATEESTHRYELESYESMEFVGEIELSFELRGLFKKRMWM